VAAEATQLLQNVSIFSGLDPRELETIARTVHERTFAPGETVAEEGQGGVGFFVIREGNAKVEVGGQEVRTLGPGDHFGEIALASDRVRTATVTAETDLRCLVMTVWDFRSFVQGDPEIAWKLLQHVAGLLSDTQARQGAEPF
jgi:CRP/FNR family transcriptional regulator, cyclic AMP receptor protein